jgi:hypothetical protein
MSQIVLGEWKSEYQKDYYLKHRSEKIARMKIYYLTDHEGRIRRQRKYYSSHADEINGKRYGLSGQEYRRLISGVCGICGLPGKLQIDHDHVTNIVRGALHGQCNRWLGFFEKYGRQTIEYLRREQA